MHEIWDATNHLSRMLRNRALRRARSNIPKGGRARCWVAENFDRAASQTRDYCVAKSTTHRAARPDPSRRKARLIGMINELCGGHFWAAGPCGYFRDGWSKRGQSSLDQQEIKSYENQEDSVHAEHHRGGKQGDEPSGEQIAH